MPAELRHAGNQKLAALPDKVLSGGRPNWTAPRLFNNLPV